jgi:deoxyribose-phosphate aldolase
MTEPELAVATARTALACLDLTSLNADDDERVVDRLCERAIGRARHPLGPVAAVCVWPRFVAQARRALPAGIRVAAVANFPQGQLDADLALRDVAEILEAGGDEIDLVLPYRALMQGARREAAALVDAVRQASPGRTLKLILEIGELVTAERIRDASRLGLDAGVDFLKTSTGKTAVSATVKAATVMLRTIAEHPRHAEVGFKAAGGLRRVADTAPYIGLVRDFLGDGAVGPHRLRFGASGLLGDIEAVLCGLPAAGGPVSRY